MCNLEFHFNKVKGNNSDIVQCEAGFLLVRAFRALQPIAKLRIWAHTNQAAGNSSISPSALLILSHDVDDSEILRSIHISYYCQSVLTQILVAAYLYFRVVLPRDAYA